MDATESLRDWHSELAPDGVNFTVTKRPPLIESGRFVRVVLKMGSLSSSTSSVVLLGGGEFKTSRCNRPWGPLGFLEAVQPSRLTDVSRAVERRVLSWRR